MRNMLGMHEFFPLPTACLVRYALGFFKMLVKIRKLTSLCLCLQIEFHVRWIASESRVPTTFPDDMTRPSILRVIPQTTFFDSLCSSCADESLTNGNEGMMSARTTEFGHFGPESPSRILSTGAAERHHKLPFQDAETPDRLSGNERLRED